MDYINAYDAILDGYDDASVADDDDDRAEMRILILKTPMPVDRILGFI